jgi:type I restriction enzyme R subunit
MRHMTGTDGLASGAVGSWLTRLQPATGGSGWFAGNDAAYDREFAVDTEQLFAFLKATQPEEWAKLGIANFKDKQAWRGRSSWPGCKGRSHAVGTIDVLRTRNQAWALQL